jgi:hypothetical protein
MEDGSGGWRMEVEDGGWKWRMEDGMRECNGPTQQFEENK